MAPAGPLPPVGGLPGGLPLRRCACSGQKAVCGAHSPPSARPSALAPVAPWSVAAGLGPGSLRAPPGARRRVPLRLPGSACRGRRRPPSGARPAPRRPRCASGCGLRRLGLARFALGAAGRPLPAAGSLGGRPGFARAPLAPVGCSLRRGPPAGRGCAPLRCACPPGSGPGPLAALAGRFLRPPAPGPLWGFGVFRRCGGGHGDLEVAAGRWPAALGRSRVRRRGLASVPFVLLTRKGKIDSVDGGHNGGPNIWGVDRIPAPLIR